MKILILGYDGYIGYPLTLHLLNLGHEVFGIDNYSRRLRVDGIGSRSLTPIGGKIYRKDLLRKKYPKIELSTLSLHIEYNCILRMLHTYQPDTIVHLAEMPSAPWSMISAPRACSTQHENVIGTLNLLWAMKEVCPEAHLVKIGTMGEYGTPNCDIPEGEIPEECLGEYECNKSTDHIKDEEEFIYRCPMKGLPFPKSPGSLYHLSKVHDSYNIMFACKTWGLRSTDIMQGVVFGVKVTGQETKDELTRFDYDEYFGTAINRFCTQAIIEHPLTVYGSGKQTRGFIPLKDSIQCLTLVIDNPPELGEYRTLNQFENIYTINDLATSVSKAAGILGLHAGIEHIDNPRLESEDHYYNPDHQKLFDMGYKPTTDIFVEIYNLIQHLLPYKSQVKKEVIMPKTKWR